MQDETQPSDAVTGDAELVLITDPMCSWCWGLWPEWLKLIEKARGQATFGLLLNGIQVGKPLTPPSDEERSRLGSIWADVSRTTGQRLRGRLPDDPAFFYHSEIACRALVAVGQLRNEVPFAFLEQLHQAFYLEGINLTSPDALAEQAQMHGVDPAEFLILLRSDEVKAEARRQMGEAHSLTGGIMPAVLGKRGGDVRMLSGGYATLEEMWPAVEAWLQKVPA